MFKVKNKSIWQEFAKYAIPAVVGMVVSSLYNIVDGIFVGHGVGDVGLGAINIVYPLIMLEIALAMLIAAGGANYFPAAKGKDNKKEANLIFLQNMSFLILVSLVVNLIVLLFTPQVCKLLGANDVLLPYAVEYIWWIALFGILYMPSLGISIFIRNDNSPNIELAGTLIGTVVNIVLDYLFIMVFDMGMTGAAIATGIGQTISLLIFLTHFLKKNRVLHLEKVKFQWLLLKKTLFSGIPTFLMEFSQSAVAFSFNLVLMARIGASGVSYYGIVMYICSIFNMVLIGLAQGAQPIMSFNYGKKDYYVVREVRRVAIKTALALTTIMYVLVFFFGRELSILFVPESPELSLAAADMMKYYFLAFFPISITLINTLYFQVTERSKSSILVSFLRCVGFIQLFLIILPPLFGTIGIYLSFFCGEVCHYFISEFLLFKKEPKNSNSLAFEKSK